MERVNITKGTKKEYAPYYPTILSPTIEIINVEMKNMRQNVAGSLKNNIPTITVPTAPMPVHTG